MHVDIKWFFVLLLPYLIPDILHITMFLEHFDPLFPLGSQQ